MNIKNLTLILLTVLFCNRLNLQSQDTHVKFLAQPSVLNVKSGEKFTVRLTMEFEKTWYSYSLKEQIGPEGIGPTTTEITVEPETHVKLDGKIKTPKPHVKYEKAFKMDLEYYSGKVVFVLPLVAKKEISFIKDKFVNIVVYLQQCYPQGCIPPNEYKIVVSNKIFEQKNEAEEEKNELSAQENSKPVDVKDTAVTETTGSAVILNQENSESEKSAQTSEKTEVKQAETAKPDAQKTENVGLLATILFAMAAGAGALLMPCVFPMVPITVSFFTKRAEQTKGKGLRDALTYAIGIIITFTALGFIFSLIFGPTGIQDFVSLPWVSLFIALIFVVFALSLFGAFEIQIPTSVLNKLNAKSQQGGGIFSVLLMGLTFSLASFSCTGPLIAGALAQAAGGSWFYPIISMLFFSLVLAAPFFLLALFPSALTKMPRAGGWMNNIKVVLAFFIVAASFKFINAAFIEWGFGLSRDFFLAIWVSCSLLSTLYIIGVFKTHHDAPITGLGTLRILFAILFATITFYLISGFTGKSMGELEAYLPKPDQAAMLSSVGGATTQAEAWLEDYNQAIAKAKELNKPVFIDFTGEKCPNCHLMEQTMFPIPRIAELMNQMVKLKLITDMRTEPSRANRKLQVDKFGSSALPMYVIISPDEKVKSKIAYTKDEEEFRAFLEKGIK